MSDVMFEKMTSVIWVILHVKRCNYPKWYPKCLCSSSRPTLAPAFSNFWFLDINLMTFTCSYTGRRRWSLWVYVPVHRDERSEWTRTSIALSCSFPHSRKHFQMLSPCYRTVGGNTKQARKRRSRDGGDRLNDGGYKKGQLTSLETMKRLS